jgi:HSP20 family molecular chaperone IbpA
MTSLLTRERNGESLWFPRLFSDFNQSFGIDIARTETGYTVEVPVPGFKPEQIEVTLEDGMLTVRGRNEKRNFSRTFTVPEDVDQERIEAQVEHGLLTLTLTLVPKAQPKRISVRG